MFHWWSSQMNIMKFSSKEKWKWNLPQMDSPGKLWGKASRITCQSVVRGQKRIQNLPWKRRKNVITQIPIHKHGTTMRVSTHRQLRWILSSL
jgi:hypothetical protein